MAAGLSQPAHTWAPIAQFTLFIGTPISAIQEYTCPRLGAYRQTNEVRIP